MELISGVSVLACQDGLISSFNYACMSALNFLVPVVLHYLVNRPGKQFRQNDD